MRIPSGVTDQYIYFVAVDATDFTTRETGLSSFTVYRSRNGGAATAMTTPTINETSSANMPGVYELLLDEDMTIDAGDDSQEMVFHITHSGMAPVTRTIELYRPKITAGNTLTVESDGDLTKVNTLDGHTAQTGDSYARLGAPAGASISADIAAIEAQTDDIGTAGAGLTAVPWNAAWDAEVQSEVADALAAYDPPTKAELDSGLAALNDLDAAGIRSAVGLASANLDTQLDALPTAAEVADAVLDEALSGHVTAGTLGKAVADIETDVTAILADTNELQTDDVPGLIAALNDLDAAGVRTAVGLASANLDTQLAALPTAAENADAVWDEALSGHLGSGSTGEALNAAGSAGDPWTTTLPGSYTGSQAGKMLSDILTDTAVIGAAGAGLTEAGGTGDHLTAVPWNAAWDAEVQSEAADALVAYDPPTKAELDSAVAPLATAAALSTVDSVVDAILVDTGTTLDGKLNTIDGIVDDILTDTGTTLPASIAALPTAAANADAVWDEARSGHATAGTFGESFQGVVNGQAITGTLSTTQMTTNLTEATDDHYNGRIVVFLTGNLAGQATDITDYTGATKLITMTALTEAPANGDRFVIV
jgi:phage baseplate assembly protein W